MIAHSAETIELAYAPDIPGLTFRRFRGDEDIPALTAVRNAAYIADGFDWVMSEEAMAAHFAHQGNSDPAVDLIIAEVDGRIAGYVQCEWYRDIDGPYKYRFQPLVTPEWRGRGLRRALLLWSENRLRQIAAGHSAEADKVYETFSGSLVPNWPPLLEEQGYRPVHYLELKVRPNLDDIPDVPMPAGLELRPVTPDQYRAIFEADMEAFRDHWGVPEKDESDYQAWLANKTEFQPALWQIAWDIEQDEIAGQIRTFIDHFANETFGRKRGWTEDISVRRPWRRRGLARAMIAESLRVLKAQGMTQSMLGVDPENEQGAKQLYLDCGFETDRVYGTWRRPLEPTESGK